MGKVVGLQPGEIGGESVSESKHSELQRSPPSEQLLPLMSDSLVAQSSLIAEPYRSHFKEFFYSANDD